MASPGCPECCCCKVCYRDDGVEGRVLADELACPPFGGASCDGSVCLTLYMDDATTPVPIPAGPLVPLGCQFGNQWTLPYLGLQSVLVPGSTGNNKWEMDDWLSDDCGPLPIGNAIQFTCFNKTVGLDLFAQRAVAGVGCPPAMVFVNSVALAYRECDTGCAWLRLQMTATPVFVYFGPDCPARDVFGQIPVIARVCPGGCVAEGGPALMAATAPAAKQPARPRICLHAERTEFLPGCSGFKCKHRCTSPDPAAREFLGDLDVVVPADECQDCPAYAARPDRVPPAAVLAALRPPPPVPVTALAPPGERVGGRCVATCAVGPVGRAWLAVTGPALRAYAGRVGAAFEVISGADGDPYPLRHKWRVVELLDRYDRVCFIDADAVPAPDCPDLFDAVPETHVGVLDDWPYLERTAWMAPEVAAIRRAAGVGGPPVVTCYNTGVVVASAGHRGLFEPPDRPIPGFHCAEQHWFNLKVQELAPPVFALPLELHWHPFVDPRRERTEGVKLWHLAGEPDRERKLRELVGRLYPAG